MKFLRESLDLNEVTISEGVDKQLFIEGCFAQAEKKNRNGRVYPKMVMENAVNRYLNEFVNAKRALGELSHPENRPTVKPELASHRIVEFRMDGNDVYGKALVLNTPQGQIVRGLLEGGTQLGVSTRGLGSIEERAGSTYVKDDYSMMAVDVVTDPSGIDCWVNAINENRDWVYVDGRYEEREIEAAKRAIKLAPSNRLNEEMLNKFAEFLRSIR